MSIHNRLALQMSKCLEEASIPKWITKEKTILIQKDPEKIPSSAQIKEKNLLLSWMWQTISIKTEKMPQGTRGTDDLQYTDQPIFKEVKTRWKNITMAWIDYKNTFDIIKQTWIIECLTMYKISNKVINFISKAIKNWKVQLSAGGKNLRRENSKRYLPEKFTLATTNCYSNDATQLQQGLENTPTATLQRGKTLPMSILDMTLINLIVRFQ